MTNQALTLADWEETLIHRHGPEIQLGLERVQAVGERLDVIHPAAVVITVAGTNGKGSTVAMLETLYLVAGFRVATYTSPHLIRFNERIRLQGQPVSDALLCDAFATVEVARCDIPLTYFEQTTLAALSIFKQHALDVIILEVGLGGRLDATNVIDADLAIMTSIDYDHQVFLGDTLEAIGFEKAGILREHQPCLFASRNMPKSIESQVHHLKAQLWRLGYEYDYIDTSDSWVLSFDGRTIELPKAPIHPNSALAALMAVYRLNERLPVPMAQWSEAMHSCFVPGRMQWIEGDIPHLFDVSHNAESVRHLADNLKSTAISGQIHAVFGAMGDKDLRQLIEPLQCVVSQWYPTRLETIRSATKDQVFALLGDEVGDFIWYDSPIEAYQSACISAKPGDLILVYGSFVTVGLVMDYRKES
jgi:dihydrofolate synthase/folylpolyglutamate synthase